MGSLNSSVETLALLLKPIETFEDGWRQGRQGLGQGETEGGLQERQGWTPVPRRKDPSPPQEPRVLLREGWSHRCRLQLRHTRVPHCWGAGVGRQRLQGLEG